MLPTTESPFCRVGSQIVYAEWQKFVNITMHVIRRRGKYKKNKKKCNEVHLYLHTVHQ